MNARLQQRRNSNRNKRFLFGLPPREHGRIAALKFGFARNDFNEDEFDGMMQTRSGAGDPPGGGSGSSGGVPMVTLSIVDNKDWMWERDGKMGSGGSVQSGGAVPEGEMIVKVSISGASSLQHRTVDIELSGTATCDTDYTCTATYPGGNPIILPPVQGKPNVIRLNMSGGTDQYIHIAPKNDAIPEGDETVILTILTAPETPNQWGPNGSGGVTYPYEGVGEYQTLTIRDDDNWKVSTSILSVPNSTRDYSKALEPCTWISGADRHGAYLISREAVQGKNATDRTYDVLVEFTMSGTATPGNNGSTGDYHLTLNPNGGVPSDIITVGSNNKGIITIPAGANEVIVYVMPNGDYIFEPDETAILTINKAYGSISNPSNSAAWFALGNTTATVTILQAPEFVSDADPSPLPSPLPINGDTYHAYISSKAKANTPLNMRTAINAANNRGVKYTLVGKDANGDDVLFVENDLFKINVNTGVITTKVDFEDVQNLQSSYNLTIRAYDPAPGFEKLYDLATVPIMLTEWIVDRDGDYRATAKSMYGCTIAELADEIGLQADEFKHWLTFTTTTMTTVTLEDNSTIAASALTPSHILAPDQEFKVPNTIYMAWFGEGGSIGKSFMAWDRNFQYLSLLGFKVVPFNNDSYAKHAATAAKWDFVRGLERLVESKSVHGLYMMGHGNDSRISVRETYPYSVVGPLWKIPYGTVIHPQASLGSDESLWTIATALNYHLGAIIIQACSSNGSHAQKFLVSSNGFFSGQTGYYIPLPEDIAFHWGYDTEYVFAPFITELIETFGGKQKTKTFSISTFTTINP